MPAALPRLSVLYTEGDRLPALVGTITDSALEGATITLKLDRPTTVLTKTATVTSGQFTISWAADDLVAGIGQEASIRATVGGLQQTLLRFVIDVLEAIA